MASNPPQKDMEVEAFPGGPFPGRRSFSLLPLTLFLTLLVGQLNAGPHPENGSSIIRITENQAAYAPGYFMDVLEDPDGKLTVQDVTLGPASQQFRANGKSTFNAQYTNSHFWLRFTIIKQTTAPFVLEIENPLIDRIEFFYPKADGEFGVKKIGDDYPFAARDIKHRNLVLEIPDPPGGTGTFYLRAWTTTAFIMPFSIRTFQNFTEKSHNEQYLHGLYYGIIIVMILYNFFILLSVRDPAYLFYIMYIASFGLAQMSISGFAFEYLWPNQVWWNNHSIPVLTGYSVFAGSVFTVIFTRSRENAPFMHRVLQILQFAGLIQVVVGLLTQRPAYNLQQYTAPLTAVAATSTAIIALSRGYKPARYYLAAWITFVCGILLFVLRNYDLVPSNFLTQNGMQIGNALEVTLISFALADKINTIKKEKEEAQAQALANLTRSDRVKDELLANTSHELRTPLNGIIGIAESLLDGVAGNLPDNARRNLGLIVASGRRLSNLVNDILDFARIKNSELSLRTESIDLRRRVDLVFALSAHLLRGKELELVNAVPENLVPVRADDNRLQQILLNLIGNAVKFTPAGKITVQARALNDFVEVTVVDTGVGIPENKFEDIFRSFEQVDGAVDREYGGTGLGLSITRQLVETHGGTIRVESSVGAGSRFIFTLPASDEPVSSKEEDLLSRVNTAGSESDDAWLRQAEEQIPVEMPRDGEFHILVVDDEPVNQQVITNHLSRHNFAVTQAMSGAEALEKLALDTFDLVLLDVMMPRLSGYETCRRIRQKHGADELPVILLTARNQVQDLVQGFQAGANDYLTKPISKLELFTRINFHLKLSRTNNQLKRLHRRIAALLEDTRDMAEARDQIVAIGLAAQNLVGTLSPGDDHKISVYLPRSSGDGYICHRLTSRAGILISRDGPVGLTPEEKKEIDAVEGTTLKNGVLWLPLRHESLPLAVLKITEIDPRNFETEREFVDGIANSLRLVLSNLLYVAQDRLAAIGRMAASIVHDLKNPMAAIKGYAEMAGDEMFSQKERAEYLELIVREINRLSDMVYDILDFARGDELKLNLDNYAVREYMNEIYRALNPGLNEMDIKLECNLAFDGPILIDGDRFRRVIYNIAGNAADAMPAGGKLIIDVAHEPGRVVFTFVDNGPGIPEEIQETLFEPFVTHGKSHGTGLGMAIVKKIVEQHGGQITYDTKRGQGTRFTVKLPAA